MWYKIARIILNYRLALLMVIIAATVFLGYQATKIQVSHELSKIIPSTNPRFKEYVDFKSKYGEDGNLLVIGIKTDRLFQLDFFNAWYNLGNHIRDMEGIDAVISVAHVFDLKANRQQKKFDIEPIFKSAPKSQAELDSLREVFFARPFYDQVLLNSETNATLMAVSINKKEMDSENRIALVSEIISAADAFSQLQNIEVHYSGLPHIRSYKATVVSHEVVMFLIYVLIVSSVILLILFRSVSAVFISIAVVAIGAVWSVGLMVVMGYQLNVLTGLIPTLLVIIGIPNSVYLLSRYHSEFKKHDNKVKALARMIERMGRTLFFTNLTAAIGFGVFAFTRSSLLVGFGLVAGVNIMLTYYVSLTLMSIIMSYLPAPSTRLILHLDRKFLTGILDAIERWTENNKLLLYLSAATVVFASVVGVLQLKARGYMLDDLPSKNQLHTDLNFFEENFIGIMPFEILVDTKEKGKIYDLEFLQKLQQAQDSLDANPVFSRSISMMDAFKFSRQAFYNGKEQYYALPEITVGSMFTAGTEKQLVQYIENTKDQSKMNLSFIDTSGQVARITVKIPDIGSDKMPELLEKTEKQFAQIFPTDDYKVTFTGTSIVALEGYNYLIDGLISSVLLCFLLNAFIIIYEYKSVRVWLMSLIPNIIPLMFTAGLMGWLGINLKPSTVLIFSIVFGMSVDYSIHFLGRFKQEFQRHNWNISRTVSVAIREAGVSMIYNCIIIVFGFGVFLFSSFRGTQYLGLLISLTLFVSLLSNLIVLPALMLSFGEKLFPKVATANLNHPDYDDEEEVVEEEMEKVS